MKIAIVGTSNSIRLDGYSPVYQALEYPNTVDNLSIGGSNCQLIPFCTERYQIFKNYDFLITDCTVNDGDYLSVNLRTADWLYNELYTIMSGIKEEKIKHLHLIFPSNIPYAEHAKIHRQVCQELNIPFIDVDSVITATVRQKRDDLFFDEKHIQPYLAKKLAYLIKETRKKIFADTAPKDLSACRKSKKYFYYSLTDKFKHLFPVCTKASSLLSCDFVMIKSGETLSIKNLPKANLESMLFWSNTKAGFYTLESENCKQNYNLFYSETHYIYFRPIPVKPFAVNNFLELSAGLDENCPPAPIEHNFYPYDTKNNILLINSLLFSEELTPPLKWEEKNCPLHNEEQIGKYQKIHTAVQKLKDCQNKSAVIPNDFIFISALIYPENAFLRKEYLKLLRKTDNPYFVYHYAKLYLIPRKKYTMAITLLKNVIKSEPIVSAISELAVCCIRTGNFESALQTITLITDPAHNITKIRLLCQLYAAMQQETLFFRYAQKLSELNEGLSTNFFIADNCIKLKQYRKAYLYLQKITEDPRSLIHETAKKMFMDKMQEIQTYLK